MLLTRLAGIRAPARLSPLLLNSHRGKARGASPDPCSARRGCEAGRCGAATESPGCPSASRCHQRPPRSPWGAEGPAAGGTGALPRGGGERAGAGEESAPGRGSGRAGGGAAGWRVGARGSPPLPFTSEPEPGKAPPQLLLPRRCRPPPAAW